MTGPAGLGRADDGNQLPLDPGIVCRDRLVRRCLGSAVAVKLGGLDNAVFGHLLQPDNHQVTFGDRRPVIEYPLTFSANSVPCPTSRRDSTMVCSNDCPASMGTPAARAGAHPSAIAGRRGMT